VCGALNPIGGDTEATFIAPLETLSFEWGEYDNGPAITEVGKTDLLDPYLGAYFNGEAEGVDWHGFDIGTLGGRCDSVVTKTDGCVDEDFTPTLLLAKSNLGSAAAMVAWAQDHLNGAWGVQSLNKPLKYYPTGNVNREVICNKSGKGKFVSMGKTISGNDGSTDSCDEYPFASTDQSAAQHGVKNGGECAQVEAYEPNPGGPHGPKYLARNWSAVRPIGEYSKKALCVRGHIPAALNSLEGTRFSSFITAVRLLNEDPFFVKVF
jgi:hypothetical protein